MVPGGYNRIAGIQYNINDSYIEPAYAIVSAIGAAQTVYRQFPLGAFTGTLLGVDRDFYSPVEQYLRVSAGTGDKMAFASTYAPGANLAAGNNPSMAAASSGQITVSEIYLYLAVEQHPGIVESMRAKCMAGELKFSIPYTTSFKNVGGSAGGQTNIQIQLSNQYGKRLKRILTTVWNPQEKFNTAYDCANWDGEKVQSYQTFLDSIPMQDRVLSCNRPGTNGRINSDDWAENKKYLGPSSCITSKECYAVNWFHMDQFFESHDTKSSLPEVNLDEGILMDTPKQWLFSGQIPVGGLNNLIYYTYAEFSREIHITPAGPVFVGSGAIY